jgi:hypothetical protein
MPTSSTDSRNSVHRLPALLPPEGGRGQGPLHAAADPELEVFQLPEGRRKTTSRSRDDRIRRNGRSLRPWDRPPDIACRFMTCPRADHSTIDVVRSKSTLAAHNLPREAMSRAMPIAMPGMVVAAPARMDTWALVVPTVPVTLERPKPFNGEPSPWTTFAWMRPGQLACSIRRPVVLLLFQCPAARGNLLPESLQHHSLKLSKIHEPPCSHGVSAPSAHWSEEATNTGLTSPGCAALSGFLNLSVLSSSP